MLTNDRQNPVFDRVPARFAKASLADLSPVLQEQIRDAITGRFGVVLHGPTGRGKTHAMAAMARMVRETREPRSYNDRWIDWLEQLEDMRRAWKMRGEDANRFDPFMWAGRVRDQIFVDDVGAESEHEDRGIEKFAWLVNERYRAGLTMSITTNLTPKALEERYGTRTTSRLYSMCRWLELGGVDRRVVSVAS